MATKKRPPDANAPPAHLRDAGRALWAKLIREFGLRDAAARHLLQIACEAADRHADALAALAKHGPVYVDRFGAPRANPAATMARDAHASQLSALRALGLTGAPDDGEA